MDIIMIRHGESQDNIAKVLSRENTSLTDKGIKQILQTKELLSRYNFEEIYYSPFKRTEETKNHLGLEGTAEPRIGEINFGIFTGYRFDEYSNVFPEESKLWIEDPYTYMIPNGESIDMAYERVSGFLKDAIKADKNILLVTHDGIIKLICSWVFDDPKYFFRFKVDNGSISVISIDDGYKFIKQLNCQA
jgi:broad specificity phosphatase PhoE